MQLVLAREPLNRDDVIALDGHREQQTTVGAATIEEDGAGSALPVVAALLGPGEIEVFPQGVEQSRPVVDGETVGTAVDSQGDDARRLLVWVFDCSHSANVVLLPNYADDPEAKRPRALCADGRLTPD
jgi:hypothetical protein